MNPDAADWLPFEDAGREPTPLRPFTPKSEFPKDGVSRRLRRGLRSGSCSPFMYDACEVTPDLCIEGRSNDDGLFCGTGRVSVGDGGMRRR